MTHYLILPLVILFAAMSPSADPALPDSTLTPGAVRTTDVYDICHTSTKTIRHVTQETKDEVYAEYGLPNRHAKWCAANGCEVDHLISLEDGGSNDIKNLWPQPYDKAFAWNATVKDHLENRLHEMICDGEISPEEAQSDLAGDWVAAYKQIFGDN